MFLSSVSSFLYRIHGRLCGDPLDLILFNKTNWILDETENSGIAETARFDVLQPTVVKSPAGFSNDGEIVELAVLRQFPFRFSVCSEHVILFFAKCVLQEECYRKCL